MFSVLARFSVRYRYPIVAFWILATFLCVHFLPSLSSVANTRDTAFLPTSSPSERAAAMAAPFESSTLSSGEIVAARSHGPLTVADDEAINRAELAIAQLPTVQVVRDEGASADGSARRALVETTLSNSDSAACARLVAEVRTALAKAHPPGGLATYFTGDLPSTVDENNATGAQQGLTERLSILFIILLLGLVFRSLLAPVLTLAPAALALVIAGPLIAEAAHAGLPVSVFTQFMLIVLILGAGTDYGLFLIFRVREEIANGAEPHDAVVHSLSRVGESITFSGSTVILAFASVLLATFGLYRGLGPGLAIGIAVVLIVDLTLLPALLAIFGRAVFWPRVPAPSGHREGLWGKVCRRIVRRPGVTLALGGLVFGGLALSVLAYVPAGFDATSGPPPQSNSAIGQSVLVSHFGGADADPTNVLFKLSSPIWTDPQRLAVIERELASQAVFSGVSGPLDPNGAVVPLSTLIALHKRLGPASELPLIGRVTAVSEAAYEAYRATSQFISPDGLVIQLYTSLRAGGPESLAAVHAVPEIRRAVATVGRAVRAIETGVAGAAPSFYDVGSISSADLLRIVPIVLLAIFLLLVLLLRSFVAPLYLILSVGVSYLAALGLSVLVFVLIGGGSGVNFVLPFFMFIFLMALGEDYNILVMSRIREEAHHMPLHLAVRRAVGSTGTTITAAGIILAGTFLVLTVATTGSIRQIGVGLAAGVLLDTFLVRSLLVPSVVVLIGRWNWWPSRLCRAPATAPVAAIGVEPASQRAA